MADKYDIAESLTAESDVGAIPALVNDPILFVAPPALTESSSEVWVVVTCGDASYGGCEVWVSPDGTSYQSAGRALSGAVQGVLQADLLAASGLDVANALSVDVTMSAGIIDAATQQVFDMRGSLCYAGGELLAYRDRVAVDIGLYDLSHLQRGLYGSTAGASAGNAFALLDSSVFKYRFGANVVGTTLYFKFQGFNVLGEGFQPIETLNEYTIAIGSDDAARALVSDIPIYVAGEGIGIVDGVISADDGLGLFSGGEPGPANSLVIGEVSTLPAGTQATASISGSAPYQTLNLGIPQGDNGELPIFSIGTVATGDAGSAVQVTITGTSASPVLNFTIPRGDAGSGGVAGVDSRDNWLFGGM